MPESSPKVLSIVWNLIRGGTEGQCARVAMGLAAMGHVHRIAVFRREGFFLDAVESVCGPVYDVGIERMFTRETYKAIQRLTAYIRKEKFEVIHLWDIDAVIFGSIAAKKAGVPYITSRRDMAAIYPRHKLFLMRRADRTAASIVANAEAIKNMLLREGRKRIQVIPNILDLDEFDAAQGVPESDPGEMVPADLAGRILVGLVARLDAEKDIATFIRGLALARKQEPRLHGLIAGDGDERQALEGVSKSLGDSDALTFLGEVHAIPALLQHLRVGVLVPKRNEGLSNTILEYMAGALPVIATDCGGNRELVSDATGLLIPVGDYEALAQGLLKLVQDADQSRGRAGRAVIEARHRPDLVCEAFAALYGTVAATPCSD